MVGIAILKIFLLVLGFVLLVKGADFFVDGASGIAKKLKVSTFVIGVNFVKIVAETKSIALFSERNGIKRNFNDKFVLNC